MDVDSDNCLIELHYLPNIRFMTKFVIYDRVIVEAHENYQKGSFRNRCHIAGANGMERLSIPLKSGKHQQKPIQQVEIAYDEPWPTLHWRAIQTAYGSTPFFEHYAYALEPIILREEQFLFDKCAALLTWLTSTIGLSDFQLSEAYRTSPVAVDDLRGHISPASDNLNDPNFQPRPYIQAFDDRQPFIPNLSIIDLLFALGPATKGHLRSCLVLRC